MDGPRHDGMPVGNAARSVRPQPREHGAHPAMFGAGVGQIEFRKNSGDVFLESADADGHLTGDLGVRISLGHEFQGLRLAFAE